MAAFLKPVVGWFTAPQRRLRGPWVFEPVDANLAPQLVQPQRVGDGALDEFEGPDHVMGLYWRGCIVAVRLPEGRVVEVKQYDDRRRIRQPRQQAG